LQSTVGTEQAGNSLTLYKTLENPAIVRALAHPLRAKMLYVLQEREASPKELSVHFGMPLSNVAYHIQILRKMKLIRLVRKTPRRGAVEHHYVADQVVSMYVEAWSQTPGPIKEIAVAQWLEDVGGYVTQAAATGGFNRDNAHLSRSRPVLDAEGWDLLAAKMDEMLEFIDETEKASAERLKKSNHEGERRSGVVMMLFESAPTVPGADEAREGGPSVTHLGETGAGHVDHADGHAHDPDEHAHHRGVHAHHADDRADVVEHR
jgi:DNA-binding transcriptional ArsR family regulator